MLLLATCTTVAAVSLAMISEIKIQRGLALVMILGIIMDWLVTRFVLEDYYMEARKSIDLRNDSVDFRMSLNWLWPVVLLLLTAVALTAPEGVEVLDIHQFLPEDDPSLDELEELREKYVIASSTIAYIVVEIESHETDLVQPLSTFYSNLAQHPSIIAYDTGLTQHRMVLGLPFSTPDDGVNIDQYLEQSTSSLFMSDSRLSEDGQTTGAVSYTHLTLPTTPYV